VVFCLETPYSFNGPPGSRHIDLTKAKLYPYIQLLHGVEVCPSYNYYSPLWRQKFDQITYGYGFNIYGLTTNNVGKTQSDVRNPSRIICLRTRHRSTHFKPPRP